MRIISIKHHCVCTCRRSHVQQAIASCGKAQITNSCACSQHQRGCCRSTIIRNRCKNADSIYKVICFSAVNGDFRINSKISVVAFDMRVTIIIFTVYSSTRF
nr:MAG TPA: hypothetical protein [Caudoviricetes sp.]